MNTDANTLLATGKALIHPTAAVERFVLSGDGAALAKAFVTLDPQSRRAVVDLAKALAKRP